MKTKKLSSKNLLIGSTVFIAGLAVGAGGASALHHYQHRHLFNLPSAGAPNDFMQRVRAQQEALDSLIRNSIKNINDDEGLNTLKPLTGMWDERQEIAVDDSGKSIVYRVPIENIQDKHVKVDVRNGMVTVTADSDVSKDEKKGDKSSTEEFYSQYQKTFPLVAGANPAKMDFAIQKDTVVIRFPKLKGV